jgi:hypothetical protein
MEDSSMKNVRVVVRVKTISALAGAVLMLALMLVVSLMANFNQYQRGKMIEHVITSDTINDGVMIDRFMDQSIELREVEFFINGERRRFAIGEIRNDDAQPGGGRLPMIYIYNGTTRVAKVLLPPFRPER